MEIERKSERIFYTFIIINQEYSAEISPARNFINGRHSSIIIFEQSVHRIKK